VAEESFRAAWCPAHGSPDVVEVRTRPATAVGAGQVGVRVHAAALNFPDVLMIAGTYQIPVPAPFVPGSEFAGVVEEIGSEVEGIAVGDRVAGMVLTGAFAQRVVADAAVLTRLDADADLFAAAAGGVAYRTAYHCLRSTAAVVAGTELVVLGAGGGVGLAAVQVGVALGARVTAVASSAEKLAIAERYGAHTVIRHGDGELRAQLRRALPGGAEVVVDPVGGTLSEPALRSLRRGGRFVTVGFASGTIPAIPLNLVLVKGIAVVGFHLQDVPPAEYARNEAELRELLRQGRVVPHIGAVHPLDDVVGALTRLAEGRAVGKVLLDLR
jgi:NADPH:quinone reductase